MVNNESPLVSALGRVVYSYTAVAAATIVVLSALSGVAPREAPADAWVHAIIVGVFALVLPLRLRGVRAGNRGSLRAVGIISGVLVAVNVAEALVPDFVPTWMRVEMVGIAVLMAASVALVVRVALARDNDGHGRIDVGLPRP
jgi:hypothetical protein